MDSAPWGLACSPGRRHRPLDRSRPSRSERAPPSIVTARTPPHRQQTSGAEKILYGYDSASSSGTVVIVEGEIDKLSLDQAGIEGAISVPDGAPAKARPEASGPSVDPEHDVKFSYIWQV